MKLKIADSGWINQNPTQNKTFNSSVLRPLKNILRKENVSEKFNPLSPVETVVTLLFNDSIPIWDSMGRIFHDSIPISMIRSIFDNFHRFGIESSNIRVLFLMSSFFGLLNKYLWTSSCSAQSITLPSNIPPEFIFRHSTVMSNMDTQIGRLKPA